MPATGLELITRGAQEFGYLADGEVLTGPEQQDALAVVRRMVDALGADRLMMYRLLRTATALTSGTRDYSIGTGGAINIVRPLWLEMAAYIQDSTATDPIEIPIEVFTDQRWAGVQLKTFDAGDLTGVYYDTRFDSNSRGLLSTYPTINASNRQLVTYTPEAVTGFTSLTDTYTFPPGYDDLFHYELSYRLQRPFGSPPDPGLKAQREEAWRRVMMTNVRPAELHCDRALTGPRSGSSKSAFDSGWQG